jgi:hypothetical protein
VWLGRGVNAEVWVNMAAGERYLVRMRENVRKDGGWRADLVLDSPEGYGDFAVEKGLKLAITTASGMGALERNLQKTKIKPKADSLARVSAVNGAALPILYSEAWYQDFNSPARTPMDYEHHPGRLVLDDTSLRFHRGDTVAVDIPRSSIETVRYGGHKDNRPNPWIKIGWRVNGEEKAATFTHTKTDSATVYYNRMFAELTRRPASP